MLRILIVMMCADQSETLAHHDGSYANVVIRQFCSIYHTYSRPDSLPLHR